MIDRCYNSCGHSRFNIFYGPASECRHRSIVNFPSAVKDIIHLQCFSNGKCLVIPNEEKKCPICGKVFNPSKESKIWIDYDLIHYCSRECRGKGIINNDKLNGRPIFWSEIAASIIVRDNKECRLCRSKSNLTVHHMIPVSVGGTSEDWNLITLCHTCHRKVHSSLRGVTISKLDDKMKTQQTFEDWVGDER